MTTLLDQAIAQLKALPQDQQETAAAATLALVEALQTDDDGVLSEAERQAAHDILSRPRRIASAAAVAHAFRRRAP